jgi:spore coat polysaccharide biosynthesis protein SpsF (cytidylyltransferase family)
MAAGLNLMRAVVRITADCPLLDPQVVSKVIQTFLKTDADYASNVHPPTFPDGLDCEVLKTSVLEEAWLETNTPFDREHVTPFVWSQADSRYRVENFASTGNYASLRWTLDTAQDLETIRVLLSRAPAGVTDYRFLL